MKKKRIDPLWHYAPVVAAKALGGHRVWLRFEDGLEGELDLSTELWGEMFAPVRDPKFFARLTVDHTLCWPNGADLSPEYLWDRVRFEKLGIPAPRPYVNGFPHSSPPTPQPAEPRQASAKAKPVRVARKPTRGKRSARR